MINIVQFLYEVLGEPQSFNITPIFYIIGSVVLLIFIDGIISFLMNGISILTGSRK